MKTAINEQTWQQSGAGVVETTQYGFRLPNGVEYWGAVGNAAGPVRIPVGPNTFTFYAAPDANSVENLESLRDRLSIQLRGAYMADEEAEALANTTIRIERTILVSIGLTNENKEN